MASALTDIISRLGIDPSLKGAALAVKGIDWNAFEAEVADAVVASVLPVVDGAAEDLKSFAAEIARDYTSALLMPVDERRVRLLKELDSQLPLIAEINRIRAVNGAWNTVSAVTGIVLRTATSVLIAAL